MSYFLGRLLFIFAGVLIGFALLWAFNKAFNVKLEVNLFNAVNAFLIIGLLANILLWLFNQEDEFMRMLLPINVVVISLILFRRFRKHKAFIAHME